MIPLAVAQESRATPSASWEGRSLVGGVLVREDRVEAFGGTEEPRDLEGFDEA